MSDGDPARIPLPFRHQLPAYSPLSVGSLAGAAARATLHSDVELLHAREALKHTFAADEVALCDSGRSALQVAIGVALMRQRGARTVGLPAFQCFEVGAAAVGADCGIALYDVDPETLAPDFHSLELVLRAGTRVVVIAPLYGLPVDWERVAAICGRYGAVAIEDAAQGHGAEWNGRVLGARGAISVVSFGRGKGWPAAGGGAVLARDAFAEVLAEARDRLASSRRGASARAVAMAAAQWIAGRPALYAAPALLPGLGLGETRYHAPTMPRRPAAFSVSLLQMTARAARDEAAVRRERASRWASELATLEGATVPVVSQGARPGYIRFPVLLPGAARLAASRRARRLGVAASYPTPLGAVPAIGARLIGGSTRWPGAVRLSTQLATLPTHSLVTHDDEDRILDLVREHVRAGPRS
jgi:dTDP-4-amino-4,6-dideoxygalactose transaminase